MRLTAVPILDSEVQGDGWVLRQEAGQADLARHREAAAVRPRRADVGVVPGGEPDDKGAAVRADRLEIGDAWIAAIGQQQAVRQRGGIREKLPLRFAIRRQMDRHLVRVAAIRRVQFDGRGFDRREASWEDVAQGSFDGKRGAVLDHDVAETRHGRLAVRRPGSRRDRPQEPRTHGAHEGGESRPGEPTVERFVDATRTPF